MPVTGAGGRDELLTVKAWKLTGEIVGNSCCFHLPHRRRIYRRVLLLSSACLDNTNSEDTNNEVEFVSSKRLTGYLRIKLTE